MQRELKLSILPARTLALALPAVLVLSVIVRMAVSLYMGASVESLPGKSLPGIDDQRSYHMLAQQVLAGHGFTVAADWWPMTPAGQPTAHWSYLYTLYLTLVYAVAGVHPLVARLIQAALVGLLQPWLAYRIAARAFPPRSGSNSPRKYIPLLAAIFTAFYGYFIYYSAALMTEAFYITAVLWSLDLALDISAGSRSYLRWALLGFALGVAVLLRQLLLLIVPLVLGWLWIVLLRPNAETRSGGAERTSIRRLIIATLITVGVMALMIIPWTVHNYRAFDQFVLLNTNAGFAFYWANHPIHGAQFQGILASDAYRDMVPSSLWSLNEAALDKRLLALGLGFIVEDPARYLLLSLSRVQTYFMFWPSPSSGLVSNLVRTASFGLALPLMLYGLVRACFSISRETVLLLLFVAAYTVIHLLSWALVRYRLPVDAVLLVFAAYGAADLWERMFIRRVGALGVRAGL